MGKYTHHFNNTSSLESLRNGVGYIEPWVSITDGEGVDFNKKMREKYLTFRITGPGKIIWMSDSTYVNHVIYYSKNGSEWTSISSQNQGNAFSVHAGDIVQFKGDYSSYNLHYYDKSEEMYLDDASSFVGSTCQFTVEGNIMSLINSTSFSNLTEFSANSTYNFYGLFQECTGLTDASNLILPVLTMTSHCYCNMFKGCTNLTAVPKFPATTLAIYCYSDMFKNCSSLVRAPELPVLTMTQYAYYEMFSGCTSLSYAPALPATTLESSCYGFMFNGCTSLTTAPELPAITLVNNCYNSMFKNCSSLNYVKAMFTTTPSTTYTRDWLSGVASSGTFVKNSAAQWNVTGTNGVPSGWTVQTSDN